MQRAQDIINSQPAFGGPIRHSGTHRYRPHNFKGTSLRQNQKYLHKAKAFVVGTNQVRLEILFEILGTIKRQEMDERSVKVKIKNIVKYNKNGEKEISSQEIQNKIGSEVTIEQPIQMAGKQLSPAELLMRTRQVWIIDGDDFLLGQRLWRLDMSCTDLLKIADQRNDVFGDFEALKDALPEV